MHADLRTRASLSSRPENFVVTVRVKRRVDVDQIDARVGQLSQLLEIVPAVDDARVNESRGF